RAAGDPPIERTRSVVSKSKRPAGGDIAAPTGHHSLVLAIEPDMRQAAILKRVVREIVHADFVVVESRDAAMAALMARVPDVLLVTALLSPRDEEELFSHLRAREGADHVQTHTIPLLASTRADEEPESSGGLFGKFRRKKEAPRPTAGCDPDLFADQIRTFIAAAQELKARPPSSPRRP